MNPTCFVITFPQSERETVYAFSVSEALIVALARRIEASKAYAIVSVHMMREGKEPINLAFDPVIRLERAA